VPAYDEAYWRSRAQEARDEAKAMTSPEPKREMYVIAKAYEQLAGYVARQLHERVSVSVLPSPLPGPGSDLDR